jgi:hypothetical protein
MSLGWVIAGTIMQCGLAYFLFMAVAFSIPGSADESRLPRLHERIWQLAIYGLPSLCAFSAGIVLYMYKNDAGASAYWWYGVPIVAGALYCSYVVSLYKRLQP